MAEADSAAYFTGIVRDLVRPGFVSLDEPLERLLELADDDPSILLDVVQAESVVQQEWARRAAELADGRPGDDVEVEAAFQALRDAGYVAEMDVGYTTSDAWSELGERVTHSPAQGLAYFHGQDTERLAESPADLMIGFDCVTGDSADMVRVGRAIADALQARGLTVDWDGTGTRRVAVRGLDRRRPLPGGTPLTTAPAPVRRGLLSRFRS